MLPKFLIADNSQESTEFVYVVNNDNPRYIIESHISDFNYLQEITWIEEKPGDNKVLNRLLAEAKEFWLREMDTENEFNDDDIDNEEMNY